jgi:hypothetical protein
MRGLGLLFLAIGCEAPTGELLPPGPLPPPNPPPAMPQPDAGRTPRPTSPDASMPATQLPAQILPAVVDFGRVSVGESGRAQLLAINPNRDSAVRVSIVSDLNDFIEVSTLSLSVAPGDGAAFELRFTPEVEGPHTGELLVDACADDECFVQVLLFGIGVDATPNPDAGTPNPCSNTGPCPGQITLGPVPVGTTAIWNLFCSCPQASEYSIAEIDPPVDGASLRRPDQQRLFLTFAPPTAGEFATNIIFREDQSQLVVPLVLIAE